MWKLYINHSFNYISDTFSLSTYYILTRHWKYVIRWKNMVRALCLVDKIIINSFWIFSTVGCKWNESLDSVWIWGNGKCHLGLRSPFAACIMRQTLGKTHLIYSPIHIHSGITVRVTQHLCRWQQHVTLSKVWTVLRLESLSCPCTGKAGRPDSDLSPLWNIPPSGPEGGLFVDMRDLTVGWKRNWLQFHGRKGGRKSGVSWE